MQRLTLAIAAGALLVAGPAYAADPFTLTSSTFKDGTPLAAKNGGNNKANPNCNGENVSPPLAWSNVPADTKSFALIVIDPEGQRGLGSVHAVAYGIPASVNGFAEGEPHQAVGQICCRQGWRRDNRLYRPVHAAKYRLPPLRLRLDRDRSRSQGVAGRADA